MRRSAALVVTACLLAGPGCSEEKEQNKGTDNPAPEEPARTEPAEAAEAGKAAPPGGTEAGNLDPAALAAKIGVEPGPVQYDEDEGASAVVARTEGKVEVRRVGTETWEETKADAQLHEGDQVRAAEGGLATLTLVDETSVEVAEQSVVAIGSRQATADPASSAAVLYGVARFTVADRAPGEGPFLVFTPGGVIATKGTIYTAGVAASGVSRVGVENGAIEVAGSAKLNAPVLVRAGKAVTVGQTGEVGAPGPIGEEDWGAWRDGAEADLEARAAAEFHARRAEALEAELEAAYAELEAQTAAAAEAEAKVEAAEKAGDPAAYRSAAPEVGSAVDASFAMSLRLQYLSDAMLAHAYLADSLYVRHPDLAPVIEPARPHLVGAVLWNKKYHTVADLHVEPLRAYYYVHHPVGRVRAKLVAYPIPRFYARVKLDYRVPAPATRVKVAVYRPPVVVAHGPVRARKTVYVRAPRIGWYAGVKGRVHPAPARVHWYVKPKEPRSRVVFGAPPSGSVKVKTVFGAAPARPRAKAVVRFGGGVDVRDHRTERVEVRDRRAETGGETRVRAVVKSGPSAPARVEVRDQRERVDRGGRGAAEARVTAGARVKGPRAQVKEEARVKVKEPKAKGPKVKEARVKVKEPKVKASVKVKAGIKVGK